MGDHDKLGGSEETISQILPREDRLEYMDLQFYFVSYTPLLMSENGTLTDLLFVVWIVTDYIHFRKDNHAIKAAKWHYECILSLLITR